MRREREGERMRERVGFVQESAGFSQK